MKLTAHDAEPTGRVHRPRPNCSRLPRPTRRGYTSHEMLDNIGLIHMNGRVYDPLIGRFLSADPSVKDVTVSQSLNRYGYVRNDPLSMSDPTGFTESSTLLRVDDNTQYGAVQEVIAMPEVTVTGTRETPAFSDPFGDGIGRDGGRGSSDIQEVLVKGTRPGRSRVADPAPELKPFMYVSGSLSRKGIRYRRSRSPRIGGPRVIS